MVAPPTHAGQRNGALVDLLNPNWRDIDLGSIAVSLSLQPRFLGHTSRPISVLEHSFAVAALAPERYRLAAILHDAREALIGDITRPVQRALAALDRDSTGFVSGLQRLGSGIDQAIALAVIALSPGYSGDESGGTMHHIAAASLSAEMASEPVRLADEAALEIEMRCFSAWSHAEAAPNWREFYNRLPPDIAALRQSWLDCVEELVCERFGGGRQVPRRALTAWLWGA